MAQQIFISYSRVDSENTERLIRRLKRTFPDTTIWYDSHLSSRGGQRWWDAILDAIEASDVFLYLLSNESLASPYCQAEFKEAQRLERPFIAVQLRDRTQIPDTLAEYQYVNLANYKGEDDPYDDLVASINRLLPDGAKAKRKRFPKKNRTPKPGKNEESQASQRADVETPPLIVLDAKQPGKSIAPQYIIALIGAIAVIVAAAINIIPPVLERMDNTRATQTVAALTQVAQVPTNLGAVSDTPSNTSSATEASSDTPTATLSETVYVQATSNAQETATQSAINVQATSSAGTMTQQAAMDATATAESDPLIIARRRVNSNAEWTPYIQEFNGAEMMLVPVGCFDMGSNDGNSDEQPVHEICFDEPFWIDRTEVTQEQFRRFNGVAERPSTFTGDNRPVENITWLEAHDFCALRDARLLREPEWEYAARGPDELIYPWGNQFVAENVVYVENSNSQTAIVGSRPAGASWVGALDMSGNVWEWVSSLYQDYPYGNDHESAPNSTDRRGRRGGSWDDDETSYLRSADRVRSEPSGWNEVVGFRCARSYEQ
jgi:formylglycine-generating enzyme required for sulfatase activity